MSKFLKNKSLILASMLAASAPMLADGDDYTGLADEQTTASDSSQTVKYVALGTAGLATVVAIVATGFAVKNCKAVTEAEKNAAKAKSGYDTDLAALQGKLDDSSDAQGQLMRARADVPAKTHALSVARKELAKEYDTIADAAVKTAVKAAIEGVFAGKVVDKVAAIAALTTTGLPDGVKEKAKTVVVAEGAKVAAEAKLAEVRAALQELADLKRGVAGHGSLDLGAAIADINKAIDAHIVEANTHLVNLGAARTAFDASFERMSKVRAAYHSVSDEAEAAVEAEAFKVLALRHSASEALGNLNELVKFEVVASAAKPAPADAAPVAPVFKAVVADDGDLRELMDRDALALLSQEFLTGSDDDKDAARQAAANFDATINRIKLMTGLGARAVFAKFTAAEKAVAAHNAAVEAFANKFKPTTK